jgi:hypothetical protein
MRKQFRMLSLLAGLSTTVVAAGMFAATSASAATTSASVAAASSRSTVTLSVTRSANTVTLVARSGQAAPLVVSAPAVPAISNGVNCYFPTCGWEFSHAQTVGLFAGGTAAVLAACHRYLGPVGLTYLCDAIAGWISAHLAPGKHQCLYVSTLPAGVIKYVSC